MSRFRICAITLLLIIFFVRPTAAGTHTSGFQVNAKAAVLLDVASGQTLFQQDATTRVVPASLAKLMTVYLAYDALGAGSVRLNDRVSISKHASRMGGSQIFLREGDQASFKELLLGVAIASGNDAAIALAEHLAGFRAAFVAQMNAKAKELGLMETRFQNPNGLPAPDQFTSARDMALLARHLIQDYPTALQLHSGKTFEYRGIRQHNRNRLLWKDSRVDGLKTGWLEEAGFHIVATAKEEDRRLIAVVLGARSERDREQIALHLINYGFKNFHNVRFFSKGDRVKNLPVWKGTEDLLAVVATEPGIVTIKNGSPQPTLAYQFPDSLVAPIPVGQKVGEALITEEGRELARVDLVAMRAVPQAGFLKRLLHSLLLIFS
ncbi:MAG: D-alanyl-D-alanine carboxypeptidase family protein [Candidatus Methylomirabilales bacterium]|nr:D-alanyl-D-alanine carboxypeptidase [candidate division NC10 bacterium]